MIVSAGELTPAESAVLPPGYPARGRVSRGHLPVRPIDGPSGRFIDPQGTVEGPVYCRLLSVRHPWAWAIAAGAKRVENRRWGTRWRGPLAIHASRKIDVHSLRFCVRWATGDGIVADPEQVLDYCSRTAGSIIALGALAECVPPDVHVDDRWAKRRHHSWLIEGVVPVVTPIPTRGRLGLWMPEWSICRPDPSLGSPLRPRGEESSG